MSNLINLDKLVFETKFVKKIGAGVLEAFSPKLYDDFYQVIREYISNSVDAGADNIHISLEQKEFNELIIEDDGCGIRSLEDLETSLAIMMGTDKSDIDRKKHPRIGTFGIGFYSGGKICNEIILETTSSDSEFIFIAKIPIGKWLKTIKSKDSRTKEVIEITEYEIAEKKKDSSNKSQHYTKVYLRDLYEEYKNILRDKVKKNKFLLKLRSVAPIDYPDNMVLYETDIDPNIEQLKLKQEDITQEFRDWQNSFLYEDLKKEGLPFGCNYNNVKLYFNGKLLSRPYPKKSEREPLSTTRFSRKFHLNYDGTNTLVGVGWAIVRGPRSYQSKDNKFQATGGFETKIISGVQLRLYNVQIIPPGQIWNEFETRIAHQPLEHIWGEIYLFNNIFDVDLKRNNISWNESTRKIKKEIKKWLEDILRKTEIRRKDIGSYLNYNKILESVNEEVQQLKIKIDMPKTEQEYGNLKKKKSEIQKLLRSVPKKLQPQEVWVSLENNINEMSKKFESLREEMTIYLEKNKEIELQYQKEIITEQGGEGLIITEQDGEGLVITEQGGEGLIITEQGGEGLTITEQGGEGLTITEQDGEGLTITEQDEETDEWELLSTRASELFSLKDREKELIKELIHIINIHVLNDDDKITISQKIFEILNKKYD